MPSRPFAARGLFVASLFVAALPPAHARAEPSSASDKDAKRDFAEGQRLFDRGDPESALPRFRSALQASGSPNARLYVARCLRDTNKLPEAYEEMSQTLREATARAASDPKYVPTRDAAAAELALLSTKVAQVIVAMADPPEGTAISVQGEAVPGGRWGAPMAVLPGKIVVTASAPGKPDVRREVEASAGKSTTVALSFGQDPVSEQAPTEAPAQDVAPTRHGGGVRTLGFAAAGLGVAGFVVFAVTGSMANSKYSTLEDECGGTRCTDPRYADDVDAGRTLDGVANLGLIVGIVGVAASIPMIVFGGPTEAPAQAAAAPTGPSVSFSPAGASIAYRGRF